MRTTYHIPALERYAIPKRGDLLQTNIGKRTERTWFIIQVRELEQATCPEMGGILTRRYKLWAERWWELEPETRMRLLRSSERAGGQVLFPFRRFLQKRKTSALLSITWGHDEDDKYPENCIALVLGYGILRREGRFSQGPMAESGDQVQDADFAALERITGALLCESMVSH